MCAGFIFHVENRAVCYYVTHWISCMDSNAQYKSIYEFMKWCIYSEFWYCSFNVCIFISILICFSSIVKSLFPRSITKLSISFANHSPHCTKKIFVNSSDLISKSFPWRFILIANSQTIFRCNVALIFSSLSKTTYCILPLDWDGKSKHRQMIGRPWNADSMYKIHFSIQNYSRNCITILFFSIFNRIETTWFLFVHFSCYPLGVCRLVLWGDVGNLPCWLLGCYRLLFTKHKKQLIFNSVGSSQLGSRNRFLRRSLHAYTHKVAPFLVANVIFNRQSPKYTYLKLTFEARKK